MGNALSNAGGLDLTTGWAAASGALNVDNSVYGAPGRELFTGLQGVSGPPVVVANGQLIEAFALIADTGGAACALHVVVGAATVAVPLVKAATYAPSRGLRDGFNYFYGRVAAPAAGNAVLTATSPNTTLLLRPYLAPVPSYARGTIWDPGSHVNPDLALPVWPSALPPMLVSQLPTPTANMATFASDTNIPITRDLYTALQYDFKLQMRLDPYQTDTLDQFYLGNRDTFYVLEPVYDRLCIASWLADGAPTPKTAAGRTMITEVGLHLVVA